MAAAVFWNLSEGRRDFYNNLWGPAYLLAHGAGPYDTSSLHTELPPVWLPMAIGIFAPLAWLPEPIAAKSWFLLSLAGLSLILYISLGKSRSLSVVAPLGLMSFLFPPVVNHLALGQFSIAAALFCLLAAICVERRMDWAAAFLLALALTKPQLLFLAVIGLGFHYLGRGGLQGLSRFFLRLPVFLAQPRWIQGWLANLQANPAWLHPSVFTFIRLQAGAWAYPTWGSVIAAGIYVCWRLWRMLPPHQAMPWTLGLTLLVSPYIWSWDFVLLLPLWVSVFAQADCKRRTILLLAYLAGWAGMAAVQLSQDYNNLRFWWVPLWFMGALWAVWHANRRGAINSS
jgi:hypothetical protein